MQPFSIAVIMKDEKKHIDNFLNAIEKCFSNCTYEIVINDTGSTDGSVKIALSHGAKIVTSKWCDDFSYSRNLAADIAAYDTIIVLDCDEYVTSVDINNTLPSNPNLIGRLFISNRFMGSEGDDVYSTYLPRIYNRKHSHFEGSVHEQIVPLNGSAPKYYNASLTVDHFGYYGTPEELSEKTAKYERLLLNTLKKSPDDPYIYFQLGQNHNMMRDAQGAVTYYEKALSLNPDVSLEYVKMMITALGNNLLRLQKPEEAAKLSQWADLLKDDPDYLCMLGLAYLRTGLLMQAMQTFLSALSTGGAKTDGASSYIPLYNMGLINEMLGNKEGALSLYRQCGDYKPALDKINELS